ESSSDISRSGRIARARQHAGACSNACGRYFVGYASFAASWWFGGVRGVRRVQRGARAQARGLEGVCEIGQVLRQAIRGRDESERVYDRGWFGFDEFSE